MMSFDWGLTSLRLNLDSISTGNVEMLECSGVMPDGLAFSLPTMSPLPEVRRIADKKNITDKDPDVYLAIPRSKTSGVNYALNHTLLDHKIRYSNRVLSDTDESSGNNPRQIEVASPNLKILFDNESTDGYCTIKIAELQRTQLGTLKYNASYVPPILGICGSEYLISLLRGLGEFLSTKSSVLSERRNQNKSGYAVFSADDGVVLWLLSLINGGIPIINHYLNQRIVHPETLFKDLVSLAGSLSTLSFNSPQNSLPNYDHENLSGCFRQLDQTIRLLLRNIDPENYIPIPLSFERQGLYVATINDVELFTNCTFILAIETTTTEEKLIGNIKSTVKVAHRSSIETIISMALPGVHLSHLVLPPKQIPIKAQLNYFRLDRQDDDPTQKKFWQEITMRESIAIWIAEEIKDVRLEMYAIRNK